MNWFCGNARYAATSTRKILTGTCGRLAPYAVVVQTNRDPTPRPETKEPADLPRLMNILRSVDYRGYSALDYEAPEARSRHTMQHRRVARSQSQGIGLAKRNSLLVFGGQRNGRLPTKRYGLGLATMGWHRFELARWFVPPPCLTRGLGKPFR